MRAMIDANPFISYLLSRTPEASSVGAVLGAAANGAFTLLYTRTIGDEIRATATMRPDLAAKIAPDDIEALLHSVQAFAEPVPLLSGDLPEVGRDRKDDYLIAHAIAAGADYIVTWDKDLLDLGQVDGVRIVTPPGFLSVLREEGRLPE
jgi:putative PIN family toxin of toxin-antitoxin system